MLGGGAAVVVLGVLVAVVALTRDGGAVSSAESDEGAAGVVDAGPAGETWEGRVSRLGAAAYGDDGPDLVLDPVKPRPRPIAAQPSTEEGLEYQQAHRFDGIELTDLFTKDGVVVDALYMDWYIFEVMAKESPLLKAQSNPYAYLEGNEYYWAIAGLGPEVIPVLESEIQAPDNGGLSVYLFATLIEEVAGSNLAAIFDEENRWGTAGDFFENWLAAKKTVSADVGATASSSKYTTEEKLERIGYYGLLAAPALDELKSSPGLSADLKKGIGSKLQSIEESSGAKAAQIAKTLDVK
jgi:hypothetical protein